MDIEIIYHVNTSRRPEWLLWFVSQVRCSYATVVIFQSEISSVLSNISSILDNTPRKSRSAVYDCKLIRRTTDIDKRQIEVYSLTGNTKYVTINIL